MSDEEDRELSQLFANSASQPGDAGFVNRVSSKLHARRRAMLAVRLVLLLAVAATIAPFVPGFIASMLKIVGL